VTFSKLLDQEIKR